MYYEPYRRRDDRRRRRRRRRSPGGCLAGLCLRLIALVLALGLLAAGALYALPVSLFAVEPEDLELSLADDLPTDRANILLLGLDALRESRQRSDSIMIATVGRGQLKLTSVLRDTVVDIPGHGAGKLNAAYAHGGAELVMQTLNRAFRLNLMRYISVDFAALVAAVDALGGVDLDITEAEARSVNELLEKNRAKLEALGYAVPTLPAQGGAAHLNGLQALAFARIRKLDNDFRRAGRQRELLLAMLEKLRASLWNPARVAKLVRIVLTGCETNMSPIELISLGEKALAAGAPTTTRLPVNDSYEDDGSRLTVTDAPANVEAFRAFAYGE